MKDNIKTILVDDERKALAILKNKIGRLCPQLNIIAETQQPKEAITLIQNLKPDLVFLDIAMPELNGFDILKQLEEPDFEIIFATAFDNYAIEAIKHCAIGYLVKPIDNSDLVDTVNNAVLSIKEKTAIKKNILLLENLNATTSQNKKLVVPSNEGLEFIKMSDIVFFEGDSGYTKIHIKSKKTILSSHSIGYYNKLIDSKWFYQIHKSYIINLMFIEKYLNEGYVVLQNNSKLPVSRNRRASFVETLKNQ